MAVVEWSGMLACCRWSCIRGANIALANKEVLVMAGHIVTKLCRQKGVHLLTLDSEQSAIFQCLQGHSCKDVQRLILTASGGPFLGKTKAELANITPAQAVKHPNWQMGAKISVDSATLMNKGLEIIEASWLFGIGPENIDVLIHPQSIVHSMVEFRDGAVLAQLGIPSMEVPIQYALSTQRWPSPDSFFLNWLDLPGLTFSQPDTEAFPCRIWPELPLAGEAMPRSPQHCQRYLRGIFPGGQTSFNGIPEVIAHIMSEIPWQENPDLTQILETMERTIQVTRRHIESME